MAPTDHITAYGKTDIGLRRSNNEDCFLIADDTVKHADTGRYGRMFVVADGMGGHAAGEVASKMACDGMREHYFRSDDISKVGTALYNRVTLKRVESAIHHANQAIYRHAQTNRECRGMGTTLSALVLRERKALIGHVGDSRIYRERGGSVEQLTVDQTEVQTLVEKGYVAVDQAADHPFRHILTQAVGVSETLEDVYTRISEVEPGDRFVLTSDGLHDYVPHGDIQRTLCEYREPESACNRLVELALESGGKDNITVVVVRVSEGTISI